MKLTPLRNRDLVFLDTETTGLDSRVHEVIELGLIRGSEERCWKFTVLNTNTFDPEARRVNGYTDENWINAVKFADVVDEITPYLTNAVWVGHNISFDRHFLQEMYVRSGKSEVFRELGHHTLDTVTLAYEHLVLEGLTGLSLSKVCDWLGISNIGSHSALIDARRCKQVFELLHRRK